MKCLLILPRPIFPLVSGYALKNYNLIRILTKHYEVKLVVISEADLSSQEIQFYQEYGVELYVHRIPKWKSYINCFVGLIGNKPLQVCYYYDKTLQKKLIAWIQECEILISALIRTRRYLDVEEARTGKIIIFDMVDSIALNYQKSKKNTKSWFWKIIYFIESKRLMNYEGKYVRESSVTYLFNPEEQNYWSNYGNAKLLPHGVNEILFNYQKYNANFKNSVVFMGKMDYQPNVDAAIWYLKYVHSKMGNQVPLIIVGAYPVEKLLAYAKDMPNVTVTGFVEDPYVYVASALAVIAPMQTGGGIQNKVLEGMALGKVNIISSLAAKPIEGAEWGKHFLVADTPEEYIETILKIKSNPNQYEAIGQKASELISEKYTWEGYGLAYINNIQCMMK